MLMTTMVLGVACGQAKQAPSECGPELAALREEMQWVDASIVQRTPIDLAPVPEWTRSTVPDRFVELRLGEIWIDGKYVTTLDGPFDIVQSYLKARLADFDQTPVVIAISSYEPWQVVRPALIALAKQDSTVRVLVSMPPPPWWDTRLLVQLAEGTDSLGEVASRLSREATKVFAECPDAAKLLEEFPGTMVAWVDGLEACRCHADLQASRALLHAIATPMLPSAGTVELLVATSGKGPPFEADPKAPWSEVLPRLLAAPTPILLPEPEPEIAPPPPPPPPPRAAAG